MRSDFDPDAFVEAYFGYFRTKDDSLFWSWEIFYGDWADSTEMVELVLLLVAAAPDEPSLGLVGAGPLEDLLWNCGDAVIDRIELAAVRDPKLRRALGNVWGLERYPAIEARVNRLLDGHGLPQLVRRRPMMVAASLLADSVQGAVSRLPEYAPGVHRVALVFAGGHVMEPVFVTQGSEAFSRSSSLEDALDLGEDPAFRAAEVVDARLTVVGPTGPDNAG